MSEIGTRPRNLSLAVLVMGVVLFFMGFVIRENANCSAMIPGIAAAVVTILLSLLAWGRNVFARNLSIETQNAAEYREVHGNSELFEDNDNAVVLARRANDQYLKYFVPFFTIAVGVALLIFNYGLLNYWKKIEAFPLAVNPLPMAILATCCCVATLIGGSFFVGESREPGCRWLRPAGAWLFLTGFMFLLGSIALFMEFFKKALMEADIFCARVGVVILIVLAVELILSFIIEFYRPRMPGEEERPLPESRILALFTEPGGVARNVAASLDYQFGFQVSEAWFYRFLERTMVPLLGVMLLAMWLQTCLIVVETEQNGIREIFGKVVSKEPLKPGLYFKLPAPFERIYRFPVDHVQEIVVGGHAVEEGEHHKVKSVILWSGLKKEGHSEEANFIVADESTAEAFKNKEAGTGSNLNMGVISAHIPLYFKVRDLYDYAYRHKDPSLTLKNIALRELIRYFSGVNFSDVLGAKRCEGSEMLRERIQKACNDVRLGIEVVFIGLAGIHPPAGVGESFDEVVAAREGKFEEELKAEAYSSLIMPQAQATGITLKNAAEAYRNEREKVADAEGERFLKQLKAYVASPELFVLNSYLDVMNQEGRSARKYVICNEQNKEVLILNLEKKLKSSLLDLNLDSTGQK